MKARETTEVKDTLAGEKEAEKDAGNETDNGAKKLERESRQRTTLPGNALQLCPHSFLCSHNQTHATYPRPQTVTGPFSNLKPHSLARGHSAVPLWVCPTRLPNLYQPSSFKGTQQPDWNQSPSLSSSSSGWIDQSSPRSSTVVLRRSVQDPHHKTSMVSSQGFSLT